MAVNKRKVLEAARKYAQKGAKEKALKEYNTLLKLDPRDAKLLLEIGDAYRRWGQIDEAIAQYQRVADQYKQDGFDARAVAVCKQILNLDPKRFATHVSLADLYQRMGLDAEAISALQTAADGFHKEGKKREALELLRKMASLDPTNVMSRLKVADLLRQEGLDQEAVSEYEQVAAEILRNGPSEQVASIYERILELQPGRVDILVSIARVLIGAEKPERAEVFAKRALDAGPDDAQHYEVLCDVYKALGRPDELADVTRKLAKLYRERGDEDQARVIMQRVPALQSFDAGESQAGEDEALSARVGDETLLGDDELLDDDEFLLSDADAEAEAAVAAPTPEPDAASVVELDLEAPIPEPAPEIDHEPALPEIELEVSGDPEPLEDAVEELPQGDPDQLLAEANVYLRYGKRAQAIASLKGILAQEPEHRAALEKIGEAFAESGETEQAVGVWMRAALRARSEGDDGAVDILRGRIAALDPDAAGELAPATGPEPAADEEGVEIDIDPDDIEIDIAAEVEPVSEPDSGIQSEIEIGSDGDEDEDEPEVLASTHDDFDVEIDIDDDDDGGVDAELEPAAPADLPAPAAPLSAPEAAQVVARADAPDTSEGQSVSSSQQIAEDLEEAEFYFQQSMYSEAERIYRRVLAAAPRHPSALLRLGEIAASRGQEPHDSSPPADSESAVSEIAEEEEEEDTTATHLAGASQPAAPDEVESGVEIDIDDDVLIDADSDGDLSVDALSKPTLEQAVEAEPEAPAPDEVPEPEAGESAAAPRRAPLADETMPIGHEAEPVDGASRPSLDAGSDATFDLAAELSDIFDGGEAHEETDVGAALSTVEDGFESIFSDFKRGVSQTLTETDYDTRYDLAIAYREMGLLDDAIGEFRMCLDSPDRQFDSLHMLGRCAVDLARFTDAINHLEQALALPNLPQEQAAGVHFDLGRAFEGMGDRERARIAYETALSNDASHPDVGERLEALGRMSAHDSDASSEGFESFEDLVSEVEADALDAPPAPTEVFESFDDVITEAEALGVGEGLDDEECDGEVESEPDPSAQAAGEADPEPPVAEKPRKGRKKKISFV